MTINYINCRLILKWGIQRVLLLVACSILISGCAVLNDLADGSPIQADGSTTSAEGSSIQADGSSTPVEGVEQEIVKELEPPNQELDAELLEQLMITNFASYSGDWNSAMLSAMSAAELSQDFRLARMAAVLALRSSSYNEVARASELWYALDEDNKDAYNALLLGLVGSGDVPSAMSRFEQRLQEIELTDQLQSLNQTSELAQPKPKLDSTQQADLPNTPIDEHIREVSGLLVRQSNADSAIQICQEYVKRYQDSAQVLLSSSYVADYFEKTDQAQQWLSRALELRPNWDVAAQMYSNMLARQDKQAERLAYIRLYLKDNPQSVPIRIQYAVELAREEDYQGGLDVMQQVVLDDPNNSDAIVYAAALAQQLEQNDLAEDFYKQALSVEPDNDNVLWSLAAFAIDDEDYQQAEQYYQRIGRGENYFRAQLQAANMRYETRGLDSAITALRRLQPRTEGEFVQLALARHYLLMQEHQYEQALDYINDSLVYLPESDDLVYARALVAAELKEIDIAEDDFRAIIQRDPEHANALNALGYTLADQTDRYEEAKQLIFKALELKPNEGHILDSMGWVLYRLEDYEEAISYLQQAFEVMPEAEIAAHLGEVYWESGQPVLAQEIWQKAYELDAENAVLLEVLKRYGQLELYAKTGIN